TASSLTLARISFFNSFFDLLAQLRAINKCLLSPAQQGAERQINRQTCGHCPTEGAKHERAHKSHDLLLRRIHAPLRRALLLYEHGHDDDDRQNVQRIRHGEIVYPEPICLPQLNSVVQHGVKGVQERHLQQERETAADWVDTFFLIERLHLLLHVRAARISKAVPLEFLLNRLHLRLDSLHLQR